MTARRVDDLVAYQFACELEDAVYALMDASPRAMRDLDFRDQIFDAVSGIARTIAEGYGRRTPGDFANFLRFSLASLAETRDALQDGITRRYFTEQAATRATLWADRTEPVIKALRLSQLTRVRQERLQRQQRAGRPRAQRSRRQPA
jgi:four helix bundle protein